MLNLYNSKYITLQNIDNFDKMMIIHSIKILQTNQNLIDKKGRKKKSTLLFFYCYHHPTQWRTRANFRGLEEIIMLSLFKRKRDMPPSPLLLGARRQRQQRDRHDKKRFIRSSQIILYSLLVGGGGGKCDARLR